MLGISPIISNLAILEDFCQVLVVLSTKPYLIRLLIGNAHHSAILSIDISLAMKRAKLLGNIKLNVIRLSARRPLAVKMPCKVSMEITTTF